MNTLKREWQHSVIYQILIDRFSGWSEPLCNPWEPEFYGGTLDGITQRLAHISALGVDAILLSPFLSTESYHGYHTTDFLTVEERFGGVEALKVLMNECHKLGLRVIADFVPHHCSPKMELFQRACREKESPEAACFYFEQWPHKYKRYLNCYDLPRFRTDTPRVQEMLFQSVDFMLDLGISGFRIDHAVGLPHQFLKSLHDHIKEKAPETLLLGEIAYPFPNISLLPYLQFKRKYSRWLSDQLIPFQLYPDYMACMDGVLNYEVEGIFGSSLHLLDTKEGKDSLRTLLRSALEKYPDRLLLPVFLDNHDVNRFMFRAETEQRFLSGLEILFELPQPVILYAGTEAGLTHARDRHEFESHGDLVARQPMEWNGDERRYWSFLREHAEHRKSRAQHAV